jgi:hypothetical protein
MGPSAGVYMCGRILPPPGHDPRTVWRVASRYTDYTTPVHHYENVDLLLKWKELKDRVVEKKFLLFPVHFCIK